MALGLPPPVVMRLGRWTPARLIVVGAVLGFVAVVVDASVSLGTSLGLLHGVPDAVPYGPVLLDVVLTAFLAPVGLFLILCGIALYLRSLRPAGRSRAFRAALGGAGLNLAAGLLIGLVRFSAFLLPPELFTPDLVGTLVLVLFAGALAAGAGLLIAFCGMAALVRGSRAPEPGRPARRIRSPRGKSIYQVAPSAR